MRSVVLNPNNSLLTCQVTHCLHAPLYTLTPTLPAPLPDGAEQAALQFIYIKLHVVVTPWRGCLAPAASSLQRLLGEPTFVKRLTEYDKDNMPERVARGIKRVIDDPTFTPDQVRRRRGVVVLRGTARPAAMCCASLAVGSTLPRLPLGAGTWHTCIHTV